MSLLGLISCCDISSSKACNVCWYLDMTAELINQGDGSYLRSFLKERLALKVVLQFLICPRPMQKSIPRWSGIPYGPVMKSRNLMGDLIAA